MLIVRVRIVSSNVVMTGQAGGDQSAATIEVRSSFSLNSSGGG